MVKFFHRKPQETVNIFDVPFLIVLEELIKHAAKCEKCHEKMVQIVNSLTCEELLTKSGKRIAGEK